MQVFVPLAYNLFAYMFHAVARSYIYIYIYIYVRFFRSFTSDMRLMLCASIDREANIVDMRKETIDARAFCGIKEEESVYGMELQVIRTKIINFCTYQQICTYKLYITHIKRWCTSKMFLSTKLIYVAYFTNSFKC